jgi:hypothetical protein
MARRFFIQGLLSIALALGLFASHPVFAACASPYGVSGNTMIGTGGTLYTCDGTNWNAAASLPSLASTDVWVGNTLNVATATATTGTGNVVMSASPTLTGTVTGAASNWSGHVGIGMSPGEPLDVTGVIRGNAEIISSALGTAGNIRMISGNYGAFFRNDGSNTYFLLTNSGDQYGSWNGLRPFYVNDSTGVVYMANGLDITGGVLTFPDGTTQTTAASPGTAFYQCPTITGCGSITCNGQYTTSATCAYGVQCGFSCCNMYSTSCSYLGHFMP